MAQHGVIQFVTTFVDFPADWAEDLQGERHEFTAEKARRYGRSHRSWRTPRLHVVAGEMVATLMPEGQIDRRTVWSCGQSVETEKAQVVESLPSGVEVCQPCAEAMALWRRRQDERIEIDRSAYNAETARLLAVADR